MSRFVGKCLAMGGGSSDVAALRALFAAEDAAYTTSRAIAVDGGLIMS